MRASVILLNYNGAALLPGALAALAAQRFADWELVVVDNGSTDGSAALVPGRLAGGTAAPVRLLRNGRNLLSARGLNAGIQAARGEVIVLMDLDVIPEPGWLEGLLAPLERGGAGNGAPIGAVGSMLLYPGEGGVQHAGGWLAENGFAQHFNRLPEGHGGAALLPMEFVTGASVAVPRGVLEQLAGTPGLDPLFPFYYEDIDLCRRVRDAGFAVMLAPASRAVHLESASMGQRSAGYYFHFNRSRLRYLLLHTPWRELAGRVPRYERWWLRRHGAQHGGRTVWIRALASALTAAPRIALRRLLRKIAKDKKRFSQASILPLFF